MSSVSVEGLVKDYGQTKVLREVSFEANDGEFVALVGPSGCGKSTLLRCIAGLEAFTNGTIKIGGRIVNDLEPKERDAAMVFQNYALYPHMTVRENMGFSLNLRGVKKPEINAGVEDAARILGLTEYLDRYPRQLSGGQRQRVAMGRAIVRKPAVFLFDEPLSNLDAALRVQMRAEIRALHKRLGVTSIFVTHDQMEAMTMADKIVVMQKGVIEQAGAPLDLYDKPHNLFVAGFIGSPAMNFIEGKLFGNIFTANNGQTMKLPATSMQAIEKLPQSILLGLRPEHIIIAAARSATSLPATVLQTESTGNVAYLTCNGFGKHLNAAITGRLQVKVGDHLNLTFDPSNLHLFDAETGLRLPDVV